MKLYQLLCTILLVIFGNKGGVMSFDDEVKFVVDRHAKAFNELAKE